LGITVFHCLRFSVLKSIALYILGGVCVSDQKVNLVFITLFLTESRSVFVGNEAYGMSGHPSKIYSLLAY
jgi:hypothetical protein